MRGVCVDAEERMTGLRMGVLQCLAGRMRLKGVVREVEGDMERVGLQR